MREAFRGGWPFRHPPNTDFELNWRSPQADGLVAWWPTLASWGEQTTLRDMAAGVYTSTINGGNLWALDPTNGPALEGTANVAKYVDSGVAPIGATPATYVTWFRPDVVNIWQFTLGHNVGVNNRIYLGISNAGFAAFGAGSVGPAAGTVAVSAGSLVCIVLVLDGTNYTGYVNGRVAKAAAAYAWGGADLSTIYLMSRNTGASSSAIDGKQGDSRIYNRALSDAEVYQEYINPWELYAPRVRFWPGFADGCVTTVTVTETATVTVVAQV